MYSSKPLLFSFLLKAAPLSMYLLFFPSTTFIKTSNPALCQQKKFVYSFKIVY